MGQFGWKIRNYKAATVYGKNLGIRDRYDYTDAMLHHSLFTRWLQANGMKTDKRDESTRDIICIDFQFGLRSYKEEIKHLDEMKKAAGDDQEKLQKISEIEERVDNKKDLYKKIGKDKIRQTFYENGVPITYKKLDKSTGEFIEETIRYKMLYRNPSKAKQGSCMFIREELYQKAYDWLTMGLGPRLPEKNAKIVEISAYAPLSTSAIEGTMEMPVEDVLILKDQDSFFHTIADIVRAEEYELNVKGKTETHTKCVVHREETDVKNTLWDGMALIENSVVPEWCNGMALLRNHFFKACAFRTHIQKFLRDYADKHGIDFDTWELTDMFGVKHLASSIKMITTDNAIKWKKFVELMGNSMADGYDYWKKKLNADGCIWGIVKTDHKSKLGDVQQMSYQMINTLPCFEEDIEQIAKTSVEYVELLKRDDDEFEKFLRKNATAVNHFEMLADLYAWNHEFANSKMWKVDKSRIINQYVNKLRRGKITVEGDNLTVCGNPYALLLYTVGEDWNNDPTLQPEDGVIEVYTTRFEDEEYLCGIRNPHNSSNNLGYFKNVKHPLMVKYFPFSNNIMAVNCIHTDVQARMNGEDFDSDFNFVTNQPQMVEAARVAYKEFPTVVNEIPESGISYDNNLTEYAKMDIKMQSAQKAIGGSSDTAQLAQSYYWSNVNHGIADENTQQYYENTVILAVCAQLAIDGCKKVFAVDVNDDIKRIRSQECMKKNKDYPAFMKWTHDIPVTKNGKERPQEEIKREKNRIKQRIDNDIICPMNWLQDCLDKIQGADKTSYTETSEYYLKIPGEANRKQMSKIRRIIEEYDGYTKRMMLLLQDSPDEEDYYDLLFIKTDEVIEKISKLKLSRLTMNRLLGSVLGIDWGVNNAYRYKEASKYIRKTMNMLYRVNKKMFLDNFKKSEEIKSTKI